MYGAMARTPILGSAVRSPVRGIRSIVHRELDRELGQLRDRIAQLEEDLRKSTAEKVDPSAAFSEVLGGLWDTTANLQAQIQSLWQRLETARSGTMFDVRTQIRTEEQAIKNKAKLDLALAARELRLNIGCGEMILEEYMNVDSQNAPGVDIVADAAGIPLDPGCVAEVFSSHLLELFTLHHCRRVVLPHWFSLIRHGGLFRSIVADAEAAIDDYIHRRISFDDLREVTYGQQERDGNFRFSMFSQDLLRQIVEEVGFQDVTFEFVNSENGKSRDMEVRGIKP